MYVREVYTPLSVSAWRFQYALSKAKLFIVDDLGMAYFVHRDYLCRPTRNGVLQPRGSVGASAYTSSS